MDYLSLILIIVLIISYLIAISLGLGLGYLLFRNNSQHYSGTPSSFFKNSDNEHKVKDTKTISGINIDETKVVLSVSTDGMEKKFNNMTQEITKQNDTMNSVNKLKQMKGR
jgi:hypothetical protein